MCGHQIPSKLKRSCSFSVLYTHQPYICLCATCHDVLGAQLGIERSPNKGGYLLWSEQVWGLLSMHTFFLLLSRMYSLVVHVPTHKFIHIHVFEFMLHLISFLGCDHVPLHMGKTRCVAYDTPGLDIILHNWKGDIQLPPIPSLDPYLASVSSPSFNCPRLYKN